MNDTTDITALRRHVERRLAGLKPERASYLGHWRELSEYILPRRGRFLISPNQAGRGDVRNGRIIDSTATIAARTLASGLMAGITSPARPWFRLSAGDLDLGRASPVEQWLDEVASRMQRVFARSNFYNSLAVMYEELGVFGTAAMLIDEDHRDVIRCHTLTAGEYYLANSERLAVDTLYREFTLTLGQVVERFGLEACSPALQAQYRNGQTAREVMVGHAVEPNGDQIPGDFSPRGMPYRSVYWEVGSAQSMVLSASGYAEFPVCAPRWHLVGNDVYGRSPGMDALGDVKALQVEQKRKAQAIEKMVNPPMVADISLRNQPATLLPGGVTYLPGSAGGVGFRPVYEVAPPLEGLVQDIRETQTRIQQAFYADLWLMVSQLDSVRTATEITERKEEKLLMLGPVLERLHAEMLDPAIKRTFAVMLRTGLLPPPPPGLPDPRHLQVQYISMLAQAQKAVATAGVERLVSFVGGMAGAHPEVMDKIDFDRVVEDYAGMLGVSPRLLVSDDQVAATRAARAQSAMAAQLAQTGLALARGADTMSQTAVGGGLKAAQLAGGGI